MSRTQPRTQPPIDTLARVIRRCVPARFVPHRPRLLLHVRLGIASAFLLANASLARAQNASAPPTLQPQVTAAPSATVTGHVVCADTQRSARFAQVSLIPATDGDEDGFGGGRGGRLAARTDLDGNFSIPGVPPGDYYLTGQLTGYINEAPAVQAALNAAAASPSAASFPADVPKIRVGSGGASAQLSLARGSVVAGTVQWDDGSPAAGVGIGVVAAPSSAPGAPFNTQPGNANFGGFGGNFGGGGTQTDDRGHFRLSGIAPGAYLVRASVQAPAPAGSNAGGRGFGRTLNLTVYAPDKLRRTDAVTVILAPGEERPDLAITMNLAALHSVSGAVGSSSAPVHSGTVRLTDTTDSSLTRTGNINSDGTFLVPYVPAGNYTLSANASSQAPSFGRGGNGSAAASTVRFQPLQESVTVTDSDLTGLSLNVTPATTPATKQ